MSANYPIVMRLTGRRCVVVGGGTVALRKVNGLVRAGAAIVVVAPEVDPEIESLAEAGGVQVIQRTFVPKDLDGATLAFAATNAWGVNHAVALAAQDRGIPANIADDPAACDFTVPALVRRRNVTLAISTGGRSPAYARHLREQLQAWLTDARCLLLDLATDLRKDLRSAGKAVDAANWQRALDDEQVIRAMEDGDREGARRKMFELLMGGR